MPTINLTTFNDAVLRTLDYLGENATKLASRDARRAVLDAYRELASAHRWSYFYQRGRLQTVASYSTGTIQYTHTGGTYEREVVLTTGTWPTWAAYGEILIAGIKYEVADRKSSSTITLSANSNPGANVASGTSYTIYRDSYPLPVDFLAADEFINLTSSFQLECIHPGDWNRLQRSSISPAGPRQVTVFGSADHLGAMSLAFFPPPDAVYNIDFIYQRRPRQLVFGDQSACTAGTATNTINSTTVTGTGTSWTSAMIGSVLRLSANAADLPTPGWGANPFDVERVITNVASTTSLTVDTAIAAAHTGVKFVISDPIDIEEGAMLTAFWRCVEHQATIARIMKNQDRADRAWIDALILAREADSRSFGMRSSHRTQPYYRLSDYPIGSS